MTLRLSFAFEAKFDSVETAKAYGVAPTALVSRG